MILQAENLLPASVTSSLRAESPASKTAYQPSAVRLAAGCELYKLIFDPYRVEIGSDVIVLPLGDDHLIIILADIGNKARCVHNEQMRTGYG